MNNGNKGLVAPKCSYYLNGSLKEYKINCMFFGFPQNAFDKNMINLLINYINENNQIKLETKAEERPQTYNIGEIEYNSKIIKFLIEIVNGYYTIYKETESFLMEIYKQSYDNKINIKEFSKLIKDIEGISTFEGRNLNSYIKSEPSIEKNVKIKAGYELVRWYRFDTNIIRNYLIREGVSSSLFIEGYGY